MRRDFSESVDTPDYFPAEKPRVAAACPAATAEPAIPASDPRREQEAARRQLQSLYPWPDARPVASGGAIWHGWFDPSTAERLSRHLTESTSAVIELGSWLGESTRFLLDRAPRATVYAVDHWRGSAEHQDHPDWSRYLPTLFDQFQHNLWDYRDRLTAIRETTQDGLALLALCGVVPDLVYLDADHGTAAVQADLERITQLFPDAVIVGDDWTWDSVRQAATEFAAATGRVVDAAGNAWEFRRP